MAKFAPIHDFLAVTLVEPDEKTPGGIIVPGGGKPDVLMGIVKNVGPGRVDHGAIVRTSARRGMKVVFPNAEYLKVTDDEGTYLLVRETQIIGWFEDESL